MKRLSNCKSTNANVKPTVYAILSGVALLAACACSAQVANSAASASQVALPLPKSPASASQVALPLPNAPANSSQLALPPPKSPAKSVPSIQTIGNVSYDRAIRQENFRGLSKIVVLQMQQNLASIYQSYPDWQRDFALKQNLLNDGIVGPITLSWLQRFGYSFHIGDGSGHGNEIAKNVERIAQYGEKQAAELTILLSPEFDAWMSAQPATARAQDVQILVQGSDTELTAIVNRFRAGRTARPVTIAPPDESAYFNYSLNQDDLQVLGGKNQIAQILSGFKNKEFNSIDALHLAIKQAMGGRDYYLKQVWPLIDKNVPEFDGYLINDAALTKLQASSDVPDAVVDQLREQGTIYFKTQALLDAFLADKFGTDAAALPIEAQQTIADTTRVFDNVHLTEQSITTIQAELKGNVQNAGIPDVIVRLLKQIQDVDYPEPSLLQHAAMSKISAGIGTCSTKTVADNADIVNLRISDDEFDVLATELNALQPQAYQGKILTSKDISSALAGLKELRSRTMRCDSAQLASSYAWIQQIYQSYFATAIENTARKQIPDNIVDIQLKGADCGCTLDEFSGVVYAFYPYWNNKTTAQTVNFSVLNRVAYYGLSVDDVGDLYLAAQPFEIHDGTPKKNEFLRIAHQYNSKVDWVIQKNDWNGDWAKYTHEKKQAVLQQLIRNIGQLLSTPLNDVESRMKPYISLTISSQPVRGDGITLYFPNYPSDIDSTLLFNSFYLDLRKALAKNDISVNILISQDVLNGADGGKQGAFAMSNMIKLRQSSAAQDGMSSSDYLLVLLNEPSTDAKKQLRNAMDNAPGLTGVARVQFLRSIIPVLQFDNHNWQQLEDDIIYAGDNFAGVGLWAPDFNNIAKPVTDLAQSCEQSKLIATCLLKNYRKSDQATRLPSTIEKLTCTYRWYLQVALTLFILANIVVAVLFFRSCEIQAFMKRYFLWMLAGLLLPPIVIFTLLLFYDPFLASLSKGNLPFIIAMGIIVLGMIAGYLFWRSQRRIPQRQRALPKRSGLGFPVIGWVIENDQNGFRWIIRNRGNGYAIIKKIEILLDGEPVADAKTALEAVLNSDKKLQWKSLPLVGQKILPGEALIGLAISDPQAGMAFEKKLRDHQLQVYVTYLSACNDLWLSDGKEVSALTGNAF